MGKKKIEIRKEEVTRENQLDTSQKVFDFSFVFSVEGGVKKKI